MKSRAGYWPPGEWHGTHVACTIGCTSLEYVGAFVVGHALGAVLSHVGTGGLEDPHASPLAPNERSPPSTNNRAFTGS